MHFTLKPDQISIISPKDIILLFCQEVDEKINTTPMSVQ